MWRIYMQQITAAAGNIVLYLPQSVLRNISTSFFFFFFKVRLSTQSVTQTSICIWNSKKFRLNYAFPSSVPRNNMREGFDFQFVRLAIFVKCPYSNVPFDTNLVSFQRWKQRGSNFIELKCKGFITNFILRPNKIYK